MGLICMLYGSSEHLYFQFNTETTNLILIELVIFIYIYVYDNLPNSCKNLVENWQI